MEELEQENKKLRMEKNEIREVVKEKKNEIDHKEKQLKDRKNEAAKLHKTNEDNKKGITMLTHKVEVLQKQKDSLGKTLQEEKSTRTETLSEKLQQEYEKSEKIKMDTDEMNRKLQEQYIMVVAEKDKVTREKDEEIR